MLVEILKTKTVLHRTKNKNVISSGFDLQIDYLHNYVDANLMVRPRVLPI